MKTLLSLRLESLEMGGHDRHGHFWLDFWFSDKKKNGQRYHYYCRANKYEAPKTKFGLFFSCLYGCDKWDTIFWDIRAQIEDNGTTRLLRNPYLLKPKEGLAKEVYDEYASIP